ncbi:PPE family protein PPE56 [Mycobacterium tuberculosis variant bovis BCG]|nr:PPE family protein PPE56 [Mycobacterium tuberculosis variant bovis BCG]
MLNGDIGPITIQPIPILPTIPLSIHQTVNLGPLVVPDIVIPAFGGGIGIPINIGPLTITPITLFAQQTFVNQLPFPTFSLGKITIPQIQTFDSNGQLVSFIGPIVIDTTIPGPTNPQIDLTIRWDTPPITLFPNGISAPDNPLGLLVSVSISNPGFTIPGFSVPAQPLPLSIDIEGQIDGFSTPPITIDRIPLTVGGGVTIGPITIQGLHIPAAPGVGNTTTAPSSGFFNSGAGGVSGFGNVGAGSSGWWNQAPSALLGAGSGVGNVGTLGSGVLNLGSGISGFYNTSVLPFGTPAAVSGIGNLGQQLSGVSAAGTTLRSMLAGNLGLANVGNFNTGFGNVGDVNLGAANIGGHNLGLGNVGTATWGWATSAMATWGLPTWA